MHHAANEIPVQSEATFRRQARIGLVLLAIFSLAYAGFIGLSAFAYQWFSETRWAGIPLTVLYGVALVVASLLIAMIYGALSRGNE
jgi:uncharacterized membrane protein (DUF485 family)